MKLLLIRPSFESDVSSWLYPWLGAGYLSAYLKKHMKSSIEVKLADEMVGDDAIFIANRFKPDIIGITSTTLEFDRASYIAANLRHITKSPILIGGPHITGLPESLPSHCDMGIQGEGESVLLKLCQFFQLHGKFEEDFLSLLNGVYYRKDGQIIGRPGNQNLIKNLDDIPMPDREIMSCKYYEPQHHFPGGYGRGTSIFTSRGCLFNCIYCGGGTFWPKPIRYHSSERVIEEISFLVHTFNLECINILDDLFHFSKPRLKKIVSLLKMNNLDRKVKFGCQANATIMDEETLDLFKQMNMTYVGFGFETGSDRILKNIKYQAASVEKNSNVLKWCRERGLRSGSGFMIGNPAETDDDLQATYDFILKNPLNACNVYHTIPFPGTKLWNIAKSMGAVSESMEWKRFNQFYHGEDFITCADVSRDKLKMWKRKIGAACFLNTLFADKGNLLNKIKRLVDTIYKDSVSRRAIIDKLAVSFKFRKEKRL